MDKLEKIYKELLTINPITGGGDKGTIHSYIEIYEKLFSPFQNPVKLLEIGVNYGESMNLWRKYFHKDSTIIGVDIIKNKLLFTDFTFIQDDATRIKFADTMSDDFDIIIDDGSHNIHHQILSFIHLFPKLKPGGLYIIEDIQNIDNNKGLFLNMARNVQILDRRSLKNRWDDVLIIITK
jgi:SAM-dependent methyltransferase